MSNQSLETPSMSDDLCVAAAQSISRPADLPYKLAVHTTRISQAAAAGVDVLVFPELSLCGYDLPRLQSWAPGLSMASLTGLAETAQVHGMTVVAGAPHVGPSGENSISSLVFPSHGEPWV